MPSKPWAARGAVQAGQDGADGLGVGVPGGNGFSNPAGAIEQMTGFERADLPFRGGQFAQPLELEGDGALGELQITVAARQGGEHGAGRVRLGVGFEGGHRLAVQVLDAFADGLGRGVGQSGAFTVGATAPPRHGRVPGRAGAWW